VHLHLLAFSGVSWLSGGVICGWPYKLERPQHAHKSRHTDTEINHSPQAAREESWKNERKAGKSRRSGKSEEKLLRASQ